MFDKYQKYKTKYLNYKNKHPGVYSDRYDTTHTGGGLSYKYLDKPHLDPCAINNFMSCYDLATVSGIGTPGTYDELKLSFENDAFISIYSGIPVFIDIISDYEKFDNDFMLPYINSTFKHIDNTPFDITESKGMDSDYQKLLNNFLKLGDELKTYDQNFFNKCKGYMNRFDIYTDVIKDYHLDLFKSKNLEVKTRPTCNFLSAETWTFLLTAVFHRYTIQKISNMTITVLHDIRDTSDTTTAIIAPDKPYNNIPMTIYNNIMNVKKLYKYHPVLRNSESCIYMIDCRTTDKLVLFQLAFDTTLYPEKYTIDANAKDSGKSKQLDYQFKTENNLFHNGLKKELSKIIYIKSEFSDKNFVLFKYLYFSLLLNNIRLYLYQGIF